METVLLVGAEEVSSAARSMRSAADTMQSAANSICYALEEHQRFMTNWLQEFTAALDNGGSPTDVGEPIPEAGPAPSEPESVVCGVCGELRPANIRCTREDCR